MAWGPRVHGYLDNMDELVEQALTQAALWDEVKDNLTRRRVSLSGGRSNGCASPAPSPSDPK